jgi:hypothetical protein
MLKYVPDDLSLGCLHFFIAQSQMYSYDYELAKENLDKCLKTHWVSTPHHLFLTTFARAKALQSLQRHQAAIDEFTKALALDSQNPYCYFRRAWSYKVRLVPFHLST